MNENQSLSTAGGVPLTVRSRRFRGDSEFSRAVARRLESTTGRFGERIRSIVVCLDDLNGARGGIDKVCRVEMSLAKGDKIHVRGLGPTPEAAVAAAAPRARQMLVRKLGRSRSRRAKH